MSTGATDTFQRTCDQIIADALSKLGAIGIGKTPTGAQRNHAMRALNGLVKEIDADGDFLWRTVRRSISIVAGTASYGPSVIGTDVLDVQDPCVFTLSGQTTRTQVYFSSRKDRRQMADVTSQGTPSMYDTEATLSGLTIILWPVPNAAGSLEITAALRAKDFTTGADTPDFTSKWTSCLVWGLAGEIANDYGQDPQAYLPTYEAKRAKLLNDDNEKGPLQLVPWLDGGGYSGV